MVELLETAATTKDQVQEVKAAEDLFSPAWKLPVAIDYFTHANNPFEISEDVVYCNGVVRVVLERGFKWDGASIPVWLPIVPWIVTLIAMHFFPSPWLWMATAVLVAYSIRILPYMQKMGRHARAMAVHDKLYRSQKIPRLVADAIMASILETDKVPIDVRWMIYRRVRQFGWIAWMLNKRNLRAKVTAGKDVEVTK